MAKKFLDWNFEMGEKKLPKLFSKVPTVKKNNYSDLLEKFFEDEQFK